ncbi:MAG: formylmethanofuran dehydrogenase subunit E family protein [Proteobacteria bacterium]|nr:formylmethanofuran dehydrogenase subunit E family protein [Pseudomonadota bacterium]
METKTTSDREAIWCRHRNGQSYTFEEFAARVEAFHGYAAPGLLLGGSMVSLAMEGLPPDTLFDAICETRTCLPDAVQMLTPCTVGNGWLRLHELGRFALTLFDKETGEGVRVAVRSDRLEEWPELKAFFFKLVPKKLQDAQRLIAEIRAAGTAVCTSAPATVRPDLRLKQHMGPVAVCPDCGEGYPLRHGKRCLACSGSGYYDSSSAPPATSGSVRPAGAGGAGR